MHTSSGFVGRFGVSGAVTHGFAFALRTRFGVIGYGHQREIVIA